MNKYKYKYKYKLLIIISLLLLVATFLFYFGYNGRLGKVSAEKCDASFKSLHETTKPGNFKMIFTDFYGSEIRSFDVIKGDKIKINYNSTIKSGTLTMEIKDPYGNILSSIPVNKKGYLKISANATGKISIVITGKNTSGSLKFLWGKLLF